MLNLRLRLFILPTTGRAERPGMLIARLGGLHQRCGSVVHGQRIPVPQTEQKPFDSVSGRGRLTLTRRMFRLIGREPNNMEKIGNQQQFGIPENGQGSPRFPSAGRFPSRVTLWDAFADL